MTESRFLPSLKLTFSPLKIGLPNRKVVFQPSICRGYVSFRECIHQKLNFTESQGDLTLNVSCETEQFLMSSGFFRGPVKRGSCGSEFFGLMLSTRKTREFFHGDLGKFVWECPPKKGSSN